MLLQAAFTTASNSLTVFGHFFLTLLFTSVHRFSIGFKSGLCGGWSITCQPCWFRKAFTHLALWIGALSCWNFQSWGIWVAYGTSAACSTSSLYRMAVTFPFNRTIGPGPATPEKHAHIITEPPPPFTVPWMHAGWNVSSGRRLTKTRPSDPHRLNFFLSVNNTLRHCSSVQPRCSLANLRRALKFRFEINGFFCATHPRRPYLSRTRRTILADTLLPCWAEMSLLSSLETDRRLLLDLTIRLRCSRGVSFCGLPVLFRESTDPVEPNRFSVLRTALSETPSSRPISRLPRPSWFSLTICDRTSDDSSRLRPIFAAIQTNFFRSIHSNWNKNDITAS